jgi:hypothetical protein
LSLPTAFPNFKFRRTSLISSIVILNTSSLRPVRLSKTGVGRSESVISEIESCVGKVFERVIFKYIYNFLIDNSLIYKYQSGFMHKHSTVHQLIEITYIVLKPT